MTDTNLTLNGISLASAVPDALVVSVGRPLVARRRFSSVEIPGRAGSWTFDEEPGDRTISVRIHLLSDSFALRREAVRDLADWADVGTRSKLIISDEPDRYHEAIISNDPDTNEWLTAGEIELDFLVGPYALASSLSTETFTANTTPESGSFVIPDKVTAEPVIVLTPTNGTLLSFVLTIGDDTISWSGSAILSGDSITISSVSDTVTRGPNDDVDLTGAYDSTDVDMADVSGTFPLLFEGTNSYDLAWTGTATLVDVSISWRERMR